MKAKNKIPSYPDTWEENKDDLLVWRKFWALWELRRKWKWANWFYNQLDRAGNEIVAPNCWSLNPGQGYMKLCLWIAFLRSVQEGLTVGLDSNDTPNSDKIKITSVFNTVPKEFSNFPVKIPFKNFRNAIFHCQWSPTIISGKYKLWSFVDKDKNGKYSFGIPFPFKPAEKFSYLKSELELKPRWMQTDVVLKFNN